MYVCMYVCLFVYIYICLYMCVLSKVQLLTPGHLPTGLCIRLEFVWASHGCICVPIRPLAPVCPGSQQGRSQGGGSDGCGWLPGRSGQTGGYRPVPVCGVHRPRQHHLPYLPGVWTHSIRYGRQNMILYWVIKGECHKNMSRSYFSLKTRRNEPYTLWL